MANTLDQPMGRIDCEFARQNKCRRCDVGVIAARRQCLCLTLLQCAHVLCGGGRAWGLAAVSASPARPLSRPVLLAAIAVERRGGVPLSSI